MALTIEIVAVGKLSASYFKEAAAEYLKRLSRYAKIEVVELKESGACEREKRKEEESAQAAQKRKGNFFNVALEIGGKEYASEKFSDLLFDAFDRGKGVRFFIGGSDGFCESFKREADCLLSFGKATFPHQLMRVVLLEQVYRAFKIREGSAYHK